MSKRRLTSRITTLPDLNRVGTGSKGSRSMPPTFYISWNGGTARCGRTLCEHAPRTRSMAAMLRDVYNRVTHIELSSWD
ncbi:MAG TPA: hypothetical protein VLX91_02260 [Candidatus Acidoferrales bacterium]|nr:hypothetical protein [Candidatus Acidoferrales bacterium]